MIIEADESDGSFTTYSPYITILTNIDGDHLSHYGDQTNLDRAFYEFLSASKIKVMSLLIQKHLGSSMIYFSKRVPFAQILLISSPLAPVRSLWKWGRILRV